MKKFIYCILTISVSMTACADDDSTNCSTDNIETTLVGSWTESLVSGMGDEVTFNENMTGLCTPESHFATEVNGDISTTFTWSYDTNDNLVACDYGNGEVRKFVPVTVECDFIQIAFMGFNIHLNKN